MSETYDGDNFFVVKEGVRMATPLLLALAVIEISDVAFAVDSIPAVLPHTLAFLWDATYVLSITTSSPGLRCLSVAVCPVISLS